jgi:hypothetical protein
MGNCQLKYLIVSPLHETPLLILLIILQTPPPFANNLFAGLVCNTCRFIVPFLSFECSDPIQAGPGNSYIRIFQ